MADGGGIYQIRVKGVLDERWSDWFNGMTARVERAGDGTAITTLSGPIADQAKLRGILSKIWDLNLRVMSVAQIESEECKGHSQPYSQPGGER